METESTLEDNLVKSPLHISPFGLIQFAEIRTKNEPGMVTKFLSVVPRPILGANSDCKQLPIIFPSASHFTPLGKSRKGHCKAKEDN